MSSEQSLDPHLIEQTKQQIRNLVNEIAQLSRSEVAPEGFYAEFLPRVISALAAVGGVIWTKDDQGRLAVQYQMNLQETRLPTKSEDDQIRHGRLLHKVMTSGEGCLVPPQSGAGEDDSAGNPTDYLLVLGALKTELDVVGVIEVFQRSEAGPSTQKGYLRFLLQMCDLAADFLKSRQLRSFSDRQVLWSQLEEFTRLVHAGLNPRDTAYTIANEGRRLIECDRVSVALRKGNRCVIEAVSGQDLFDKRSNTVRMLGKLATVVVASGEPVWYTGDTSNMAPQVEDALQEYVDESHTKAVAVLPLRRTPLVEKEKERPDDVNETSPPVGALIVEQIEDSRVPAKMVQRVEVVSQHSAMALANCLEHEGLFLMPVWRTLGKSRVLTHARTLPKVVLAVAGVVAAALVLVLVPAELKMNSNGTLEPIERRDVFAAVDDARVDKVLVEHAQNVQAGQLLVRLKNDRLDEQLPQVRGDLVRTQHAIDALNYKIVQQRELIQNRDRDSEYQSEQASDLQGQVLQQETQLTNLKTQLRVLERQEKDLEVRSPVDGQVITWELEKKLDKRPLQRGARLLQVADADKGWRVELQMPDDRMAHILAAQGRLLGGLRERLREAMETSWREKLRAEVEDEVRKEMAVAMAVPEPALAVDASADPAGAGAVAPETPDAPAPAGDSADALGEMDRRVETVLAARAAEQTAAEMAKIDDRQIKAKLEELTGEVVEDRLKVEYILATNSGRTHVGWIEEIGSTAEVHGDQGNTVKIKVAINKDDIRPEDFVSGTTVTAKVACGRRALGYVWFHDLFAWAQKMWFRWF